MNRRLELILGAALISAVPLLATDPTPPIPAAPIPAQITAARTVFISNAGTDAVSLAAFQRAGDVHEVYDRFYAAMKDWGKYELAGAPAAADLVFQLRFEAPVSDCTKGTSHSPALEVTILDPKTRITLWSFTEPVNPALLKSTWERNVSEGIAAAMKDLKALQ